MGNIDELFIVYPSCLLGKKKNKTKQKKKNKQNKPQKTLQNPPQIRVIIIIF